jgi:hypothetical protein
MERQAESNLRQPIAVAVVGVLENENGEEPLFEMASLRAAALTQV